MKYRHSSTPGMSTPQRTPQVDSSGREESTRATRRAVSAKSSHVQPGASQALGGSFAPPAWSSEALYHTTRTGKSYGMAKLSFLKRYWSSEAGKKSFSGNL